MNIKKPMKDLLLETIRTTVEYYEVTEADILMIFDNIADGFEDEFCLLVQSEVFDAMDRLNIKTFPMTLPEQEQLQTLLLEGDFIPDPNQTNPEDAYDQYVWTDQSAAQAFIDKHPQAFIYSVFEENEKIFVTPGIRVLDHIGFMFNLTGHGLGYKEKIRIY